MTKIYSYVLRVDDGAAPNPFWDTCTLTICKPVIRRKASVGDWVIGTGSANAEVLKNERVNLSGTIVYAMKITKILTLEEYDRYCKENLPGKIPVKYAEDWRLRVGDCIYHDFADGRNPAMRKGVHSEANRRTDLNGHHALLSDHFYYFGLAARELPLHLRPLIKTNQGHKIISDPELVRQFEEWISKEAALNTLSADPQLSWYFSGEYAEEEQSRCGTCRAEDDLHEEEEVIC